MNIWFIFHDLKASLKTWMRSIGTVFWTILFPILLILIFGAIFSGADEVSYELVIQNFDDGEFSEGLIDILDNISILKLEFKNDTKDIKSYLLDNDKSAGIMIPSDFSDTIQSSFYDPNATVNISFYSDPSDQTVAPIIQNIVSNVLSEYNQGITQGKKVIDIKRESILAEDFEFIDFFIPGIIGFTIMTSMIYGSIERNTKFRKDGILRKLQTMPVSRADWIISKMLFMLVLSFISSFVIIGVGILVWGISIKLNIFFFILVIGTSFMFSGMGMIISRFVKEEETADMAGGAITFPMMFLAGTFFPLEQMPAFLQNIAQVLPLYYVNEGFRNAMIYGDMDKILYFTGIVVVFAAVFFILGVLLTKWHED